jgi:hypothetical protein
MRLWWAVLVAVATVSTAVRAEPLDESLESEAPNPAEPVEPAVEAAPAEDCPCPTPEAEPAPPPDPLEGQRSTAVHKDVVPEARGFTIALRVGWAMPHGEEQRGRDLNDAVVGLAPIWLDLGYRVTDNLMVGVYAHYAFAVPQSCRGDGSCVGSDVRFGLQGQWHFGARQSTDHWVGLGTGFEIYEEEIAGVTRRFTGYEFVNAQFGEDWSLGHRLGIGPFVSLSLGKFTAVYVQESNGATTDLEISDKTLHGWALLGVRLSFGA